MGAFILYTRIHIWGLHITCTTYFRRVSPSPYSHFSTVPHLHHSTDSFLRYDAPRAFPLPFYKVVHCSIRQCIYMAEVCTLFFVYSSNLYLPSCGFVRCSTRRAVVMSWRALAHSTTYNSAYNSNSFDSRNANRLFPAHAYSAIYTACVRRTFDLPPSTITSASEANCLRSAFNALSFPAHESTQGNFEGKGGIGCLLGAL